MARTATSGVVDAGGREMWLFTAAFAAPAVDVAFSPRWSTRREELYSPLAYDAAGLGGRVGLAVPTGRWEVTAGIDVSMGRGRSGPAFSFVADGETLETPSSSLVDVRIYELWDALTGMLAQTDDGHVQLYAPDHEHWFANEVYRERIGDERFDLPRARAEYLGGAPDAEE
jgi:hypothetical protein